MWSLRFSKSNKTLSFSQSYAGETHHFIYIKAKNKLKRKYKLDCYGVYHSPKSKGRNKNPEYYCNGKKISDTQIEKYINKYADQQYKLKYKKIK